jgi:hypothetical protein
MVSLFWLAEHCGADYPVPPRSLDRKVTAAEVIVLGTATLFGPKDQVETKVDYVQNIRVQVKAVLWPQSFTDTSDIVFRYYVHERWPKSWWAYTNTPGVFFLVKGTYNNAGSWDRLPFYDDWIESPTNTLAVLLSVNRQKGQASTNGLLAIPSVPLPLNTRYDGDALLREIYLIAFHDGYFAALAADNHVLMFSPRTDEDKAKVLGFADGQAAGDQARRLWLKRLGM